MTTRDELRRLPDLAAEAFATWGAPNPGETVARAPRRVHPPAPTDLTTLVALRPDTGLLTGIVECVRIVWEVLRHDEARHELPDPRDTETPTWASECDWLLATLDWWQANLDACDLGWITDTIHAATRELEQIVRQPRPARLVCPDCGDVLRGQPGGMVSLCDSGHEHPGPKRLAAVWARKPAVPAMVIESQLGVKVATLWQWKRRGKIRPAHTEGRIDYWLPWDVVRLLYPGIEDTLAEGA